MTKLKRAVRPIFAAVAGFLAACQSSAGVPDSIIEERVYRYQNSRSLQSYLQVSIYADGSWAIAYTDEDSNGDLKTADRGSGETVLESADPAFVFFLPKDFDPYLNENWAYGQCLYRVKERGNFPTSVGRNSPFANIEATCVGQPIANYFYSSEFGLLGISFGPAPASSNEDAHFFTANQSYWLIGDRPAGFSPQPTKKVNATD